jgi:hypothetical protein
MLLAHGSKVQFALKALNFEKACHALQHAAKARALALLTILVVAVLVVAILGVAILVIAVLVVARLVHAVLVLVLRGGRTGGTG